MGFPGALSDEQFGEWRHRTFGKLFAQTCGHFRGIIWKHEFIISRHSSYARERSDLLAELLVSPDDVGRDADCGIKHDGSDYGQ